MTYNTVEEFKLRAYPSGSYNTISDETIGFYLSSSCAQINAALQRYHSLPLNEEEHSDKIAFIKQGEIAIASYNLMLFRGFKPDVIGEQDETLQTQFSLWADPEVGYLSQFQKGNLRLQPEADNTPTNSEGRSKLFGKQSNYNQKLF